jgi:hypothetical protein
MHGRAERAHCGLTVWLYALPHLLLHHCAHHWRRDWRGDFAAVLAYSAILGQTPDVYVAQLAPAAVVGNIFAIICAGSLARLGAKRPALSGNGMLTRSKDDASLLPGRKALSRRIFI